MPKDTVKEPEWFFEAINAPGQITSPTTIRGPSGTSYPIFPGQVFRITSPVDREYFINEMREYGRYDAVKKPSTWDEEHEAKPHGKATFRDHDGQKIKKEDLVDYRKKESERVAVADLHKKRSLKQTILDKLRKEKAGLVQERKEIQELEKQIAEERKELKRVKENVQPKSPEKPKEPAEYPKK